MTRFLLLVGLCAGHRRSRKHRGHARERRGTRDALGIGGFIVLLLLSWATGTDFLSLLPREGLPSENIGTSGDGTGRRPRKSRWSTSWTPSPTTPRRRGASCSAAATSRRSVVLFRDAIQSACGSAQSATGPFYCPGDRKVYLDLGFFNELARPFGAPGDFAQAYVITHEIGHHVQNLLDLGVGRALGPGAEQRVGRASSCRPTASPGCGDTRRRRTGNFDVGRVELEPGDAEEALRAAAAIGDDRLQKMSTGRVMPDRFTHGSSAQRVEWFRRGMRVGGPAGLRYGREVIPELVIGTAIWSLIRSLNQPINDQMTR